MKYWLKLALSTLAVTGVVLSGAVGVLSTPTPAAAVEEAPVMTVAAKNTTVTVGADALGTLFWSEDA